MDKLLYDRGLAKRRHVLGEAYVDRALSNVNGFNREFQRLTTEYCWGEVWGDETLSPRERSILTLGMVAALGKMGEFANHVRGAAVNGLTPKELSAVLVQIAIYCGIPVGADCFQVAEETFRIRASEVKRKPAMHSSISTTRIVAVLMCSLLTGQLSRPSWAHPGHGPGGGDWSMLHYLTEADHPAPALGLALLFAVPLAWYGGPLVWRAIRVRRARHVP